MAIAEGYAQLAEVKADLRLTTTVDDQRIERCIEAASRLVDHIAKRRWVPDVGAVRTFTSDGCMVFVGDLDTITTVEESDDQVTWAEVTDGWVTHPYNPPVRRLELITGRAWARFVRITGDYDVSPIPPNINAATRIEAVRLFKRPDTPEGVLVGDFGAARLARVDPDFFALVGATGKRRVLG